MMRAITDTSSKNAQTHSSAAQANLTISQPADSHEREADRVADHVMRMPEGEVPRELSCRNSLDDPYLAGTLATALKLREVH